MPQQLLGTTSHAARTLLSDPAIGDPNRHRAIAAWCRRLASEDPTGADEYLEQAQRFEDCAARADAASSAGR